MKPVILGSVSVLALGVGAAQAAGPGFDWNGPYIGGNVGIAFLDGTFTAFDTLGPASADMDDSDITFGGQVGWNFRHDMFVFGVEGDINYLDLEDDHTFVNKDTVPVRVDYDWFATLRGRAGILVNPNLLIYGTGGVAFLESDLSISSSVFGAFSASDTDILVGWTAGGGIEYSFNESLSVKAEYLYADFGEHDLTVPAPAGGGAEPELHVIRAGLNWHFCTGMGC